MWNIWRNAQITKENTLQARVNCQIPRSWKKPPSQQQRKLNTQLPKENTLQPGAKIQIPKSWWKLPYSSWKTKLQRPKAQEITLHPRESRFLFSATSLRCKLTIPQHIILAEFGAQPFQLTQSSNWFHSCIMFGALQTQ